MLTLTQECDISLLSVIYVYQAQKDPGGKMEIEGTPRRHLFPIDRTQPAYLSTTLNPTTDEIPQKNF